MPPIETSTPSVRLPWFKLPALPGFRSPRPPALPDLSWVLPDPDRPSEMVELAWRINRMIARGRE